MAGETEDGFCSEGLTQRRRDAKAYNADGSPAVPQFSIRTNGILVPARDAGVLADAMQWMVEHGEERGRMGCASRALAEAEFGIEKVVEQTLALYNRE